MPEEIRYSDTELEEFRTLLYNKITIANKELDHLREMIAKKTESPSVDLNRPDTETNQLIGLRDRQSAYITKLEEALARIDDKTYGICTVTGKLIDKERLRAIPHATLNIEATLKTAADPISEATKKKKLPVKNPIAPKVRACRVCGCTEDDCSQCIEKTGHACWWVEDDLCSACFDTSVSTCIEGFNYNKHGVCINPEFLIKYGGGKMLHYVISVAKVKDGWVYGYRYSFPNSRFGSGGASLNNKSFVTKQEAALEAALFIKKQFYSCLKNVPDLKARDHELNELRTFLEGMKPEYYSTSNNNNDMNFFTQLNTTAPGADLSITLKEKNGQYTMCILPNMGSKAVIKPLLVTGTPAELDDKFFDLITKPLQEAFATLKNADEFNKSVEEAVKKEAVKPKEKKKTEPKPADKKAAKKAPEKKETKTEEPDLFAE